MLTLMLVTHVLLLCLPCSTMTWGVFWFFGFLILAMTGYVACCLPETKGINVENVMGAWARCASARPSLPH